jgi:hypothetical protein
MNQKSFASLFFSLLTISSIYSINPTIPDPIVIRLIKTNRISKVQSRQERFLLKRRVVKHALYGCGLLGAIYLMNYAMKYEVNRSAEQAAILINNKKIEQAQAGWWSWVKSVPGDIAHTVKMSIPGVIANQIISFGWSKLGKTITDRVEEESLSWFYLYHTHLSEAFNIVKSLTVVLDPHSFYLDYDRHQAEQKIILEEFIGSVKKVLNDQNNDFFKQLGLKKMSQQIRQAKMLTSLSDDIILTEGQKLGAQENDPALIAQKAFTRKNVELFVSKIRQDIEQLIAFGLARYSFLTIENPAIKQLIDLTNRYIQDVERLLNLSDLELEAESQSKRGIFTKTIEFIKHFETTFGSLKLYVKYHA